MRLTPFFPFFPESVESSAPGTDEILVSGRLPALEIARSREPTGTVEVKYVRFQRLFQFQSHPNRFAQRHEPIEAGFQTSRQFAPIRRPLRGPEGVRHATTASTEHSIRWPVLQWAASEFNQQPDPKRFRRSWQSPQQRRPNILYQQRRLSKHPHGQHFQHLCVSAGLAGGTACPTKTQTTPKTLSWFVRRALCFVWFAVCLPPSPPPPPRPCSRRLSMRPIQAGSWCVARPRRTPRCSMRAASRFVSSPVDRRPTPAFASPPSRLPSASAMS